MTSSDAPEALIHAPTTINDELSAELPEKTLTALPVVVSRQSAAPGLPQELSEGFPLQTEGSTETKTAETTVLSTPFPILADTPATDSIPPSLPVPQIGKTSVPIVVSSDLVPHQAIKPKSKKKKIPPVVTMATAVTATSGGPGTQGENTGRWTAEEHRLFLQGLEQHGKGWKKIASLIKSRTVVQIRTHAQKYFQKLAKARQNGEEGEISMEGRGGPTSVTSGGLPGIGFPSSKRRRQTTGTKRKAITSVVVSATREGQNMAAAQAAAGVSCPVPPLPAVAPALAPFVVPHPQPLTTVSNQAGGPSIAAAHGSISGTALEDSLFRFLTPAPIHGSNDAVQVNEVARQVGANPITLPSDYPTFLPSCGEVSPTGVSDAIFPSWTDVKDMPSWYSKGTDIDCLLDVADTLDWLTDSGDLHETYEPPPSSCQATEHSSFNDRTDSDEIPMLKPHSVANLSSDSLPCCVQDVVPPLPSLFESEPSSKRQKLSSHHLSDMDDDLDVFDTPMEEHAFVSALLENNGESSGSLPVLS